MSDEVQGSGQTHISIVDNQVGGGIQVHTSSPKASALAEPAIRYSCQIPFACRSFVHRREFDQIINFLVATRRSAGEPQSPSMMAVRGPGGFGKTTLAAAVCHAWETREIFSDGILWTHIGRGKTDLEQALALRQSLSFWSGREIPECGTLHEIGASLKHRLHGKRVLWVLDDVWTPSVCRAFADLAPPASILVTTRIHDVVLPDSRYFDVGKVQVDEAVEILTSGVEPADSLDFRQLAHRLGRWPLLLALCNAQLRRLNQFKLGTSAALDRVVTLLGTRGLKAFDRDDPGERSEAVASTIAASFDGDVLHVDDRLAFLELAIFPEDAAIPLAILTKLWGQPRTEVEERCVRFFDRSLALHLDLQAQVFRLHSVFWSYLQEEQREKLVELHRRLLGVLRPSTGDWADLPDTEDYLWLHLSHHLLEAELVEELETLLTNFRFLTKKLGKFGPYRLLGDFEGLDHSENLVTIRGAVRLSAHILAQDPSQLASQFIGRLHGNNDFTLQMLVDQARSEGRGLLPRLGSLRAPDSLEQTLLGHDSDVADVIALGSSRVISASRDKTLRIWDLETGSVIQAHKGHKGWVRRVALLNSKYLLSASEDRTVRAWRIEDGTEHKVFEGHSGGVLDVSRIDGDHFASCSRDGTVRIWKFEEGEVRVLEGHEGEVFSVALVSDGRLVSASADGTLKVWDVSTGKLLKVLNGHQDWILAVCRVDDQRVASGSADKTVRIWNLDSGRVDQRLEGHTGGVRAIAVLPGRQLVSASEDRTLRIWDTDNGELLRVIRAHPEPVHGVADLGTERIASVSRDMSLRVWSLRKPEGRPNPSGSRSGILTIDARKRGSHDQGLYATGLDDGTIRLGTVGHCTAQRSLSGHEDAVLDLCFLSRDRLLSSSFDRTIRLWDLQSGKPLQTLLGHEAEVFCVALLTPETVASGAYDHALKIWDLTEGRILRTLKGHTYGIHAVARLDEDHLVSASADKSLRIWNYRTGESIRVLKGHTRGVLSVAVLDQGRVVSASGDKTLRLWDVTSGAELKVLEGHKHVVQAVAMLDHQRIVSAGDDCRICVWDLETGQVCASFFSDWPCRTLARLDSTTILAGDLSGQVHVLDLDSKLARPGLLPSQTPETTSPTASPGIEPGEYEQNSYPGGARQ